MRTVVVGTAGHIDHGKSALVTALTGSDPDRLKEEKARGITIELGFAHAPVAADVTASFVDVPGHERFVRAMLAGVGGIDLVLLVVAADESVMPQTREHFEICRLLGLTRGLIVLTKADLADADLRELVAGEARDLVAGSFLDGAPILPVSVVTGEGLEALRAAIATLARATTARDATGAVRLPIDRVFTMKGFGTVVTGTLVGGALSVDDELTLLPADRRVKVRGLHVHGGTRPAARAGERVAVNLAGLDVADVARGAVVAANGAFAATRHADVRLTLLPSAALRHGARVRVHQGTAELLARVALSGAATAIEPGGLADVRLRFEREAVLARGDKVIVRTYSPLATIGGGVVLDPSPPRRGVRTARGVARMAALAPRADRRADREQAAAAMIEAAGAAGVSIADLARRLGAPSAAVRASVDTLSRGGRVSASGDWAVMAALIDRRSAAMLDGLATFHREQPLAPGVGLEDARSRWFRRVPPPIVDGVIAALVAARRLVATDTLALASHRVSLTPVERALKTFIEARMREGGLTPPDVTSLPADARQPAAAVDDMLQLLIKEKRLVRVDSLVFHRETLDRLKAEIVARKSGAPDGRATVDVRTFKDAYDITRKYAIPLLEFLDRERVTRRVGDVRVVL